MLGDFSLDKEFDEVIDLTPLIDMAFILFIFFFITSTFIRTRRYFDPHAPFQL